MEKLKNASTTSYVKASFQMLGTLGPNSRVERLQGHRNWCDFSYSAKFWHILCIRARAKKGLSGKHFSQFTFPNVFCEHLPEKQVGRIEESASSTLGEIGVGLGCAGKL